MSKILVRISTPSHRSEYPDLNFLGHTTTIEFDEISSLADLEDAFVRIAHTAGFSYVVEVECVHPQGGKQ